MSSLLPPLSTNNFKSVVYIRNYLDYYNYNVAKIRELDATTASAVEGTDLNATLNALTLQLSYSGVVVKDDFSAVVGSVTDGREKKEVIWTYLITQGIVDGDGVIDYVSMQSLYEDTSSAPISIEGLNPTENQAVLDVLKEACHAQRGVVRGSLGEGSRAPAETVEISGREIPLLDRSSALDLYVQLQNVENSALSAPAKKLLQQILYIRDYLDYYNDHTAKIRIVDSAAADQVEGGGLNLALGALLDQINYSGVLTDANLAAAGVAADYATIREALQSAGIIDANDNINSVNMVEIRDAGSLSISGWDADKNQKVFTALTKACEDRRQLIRTKFLMPDKSASVEISARELGPAILALRGSALDAALDFAINELGANSQAVLVGVTDLFVKKIDPQITTSPQEGQTIKFEIQLSAGAASGSLPVLLKPKEDGVDRTLSIKVDGTTTILGTVGFTFTDEFRLGLMSVGDTEAEKAKVEVEVALLQADGATWDSYQPAADVQFNVAAKPQKFAVRLKWNGWVVAETSTNPASALEVGSAAAPDWLSAHLGTALWTMRRKGWENGRDGKPAAGEPDTDEIPYIATLDPNDRMETPADNDPFVNPHGSRLTLGGGLNGLSLYANPKSFDDYTRTQSLDDGSRFMFDFRPGYTLPFSKDGWKKGSFIPRGYVGGDLVYIPDAHGYQFDGLLQGGIYNAAILQEASVKGGYTGDVRFIPAEADPSYKAGALDARLRVGDPWEYGSLGGFYRLRAGDRQTGSGEVLGFTGQTFGGFLRTRPTRWFGAEFGGGWTTLSQDTLTYAGLAGDQLGDYNTVDSSRVVAGHPFLYWDGKVISGRNKDGIPADWRVGSLGYLGLDDNGLIDVWKTGVYGGRPGIIETSVSLGQTDPTDFRQIQFRGRVEGGYPFALGRKGKKFEVLGPVYLSPTGYVEGGYDRMTVGANDRVGRQFAVGFGGQVTASVQRQTRPTEIKAGGGAPAGSWEAYQEDELDRQLAAGLGDNINVGCDTEEPPFDREALQPKPTVLERVGLGFLPFGRKTALTNVTVIGERNEIIVRGDDVAGRGVILIAKNTIGSVPRKQIVEAFAGCSTPDAWQQFFIDSSADELVFDSAITEQRIQGSSLEDAQKEVIRQAWLNSGGEISAATTNEVMISADDFSGKVAIYFNVQGVDDSRQTGDKYIVKPEVTVGDATAILPLITLDDSGMVAGVPACSIYDVIKSQFDPRPILQYLYENDIPKVELTFSLMRQEAAGHVVPVSRSIKVIILNPMHAVEVAGGGAAVVPSGPAGIPGDAILTRLQGMPLIELEEGKSDKFVLSVATLSELSEREKDTLPDGQEKARVAFNRRNWQQTTVGIYDVNVLTPGTRAEQYELSPEQKAVFEIVTDRNLFGRVRVRLSFKEGANAANLFSYDAEGKAHLLLKLWNPSRRCLETYHLVLKKPPERVVALPKMIQESIELEIGRPKKITITAKELEAAGFTGNPEDLVAEIVDGNGLVTAAPVEAGILGVRFKVNTDPNSSTGRDLIQQSRSTPTVRSLYSARIFVNFYDRSDPGKRTVVQFAVQVFSDAGTIRRLDRKAGTAATAPSAAPLDYGPAKTLTATGLANNTKDNPWFINGEYGYVDITPIGKKRKTPPAFKVEPAVGVQYTYNTTLNELMITGQNWSLVLDNPQVLGIDSQDDIDTASSSGPDAPGHFAVLTDDTGKLSIIVYPNLEAAALAADPRLQFSGTYFHPVLNTTFKLVVPIVSAEEADE